MTHRDIVSYLLQRKFISAEAIVEGDLTAIAVSRRHENFRIASKPGRSYFIKHAAGSAEADTLRHEAAIYRILQAPAESDGPKNHLPQYYDYDEKRRLLILELLSESESLREHHVRQGRFSESVAELLAEALSSFHSFKGIDERHMAFSRYNDRPPWVFSIHRSNPLLIRDSSAANLELIKIILQFSQLCEALDALGREWKKETLIHCDLKWDNCLLRTGRRSERKRSLKIVDWELASLGDPCWDIGSAFSDYLALWLFSIPITGETQLDGFSEFARYPLKKMLPAIRRLWETYAKRMGYNSEERAERLIRSVKYSAARLIQTGYEHMQRSERLNGAVVCLLQLSMNMLLRPREAASQLLCIS